MATIQSNPTPNSPKFTPTPAPKKSGNGLFIGIIVALLVGLAVLGVAYMNRGNENAELTAQNIEVEQFRAEAEKLYYESLSELEEMKGSNEELNALIDQQKEELRVQKEKVSALTRDSRNLGAARRELAELRTQVQGYVAEIETLRAQNAELADNNQRLSTERDLLSTDLQASRQTNEQLNSERAVLVSERDELTQNNQELSRKVGIASVIKTNNISAVGQKQRNSGRWVNRNNAKNVERLYVCFNSLDNAVAEPGEETFQMRVINPTGETISIDSEGSGILTSAETGDRIPYTKSVSFGFDGNAANHCAEWNVANQQYAEGSYQIELYNKGFLVGTTALELK